MHTYKLNAEHNGIEIYFESRPPESTLQDLRDNGWRWHSVKRCWFTKKSEKALAFAKELTSNSEKHEEISQYSALSSQTQQVNFTQTQDSVYVSTVTISKSQSGFHISSTNNQIICCDCGRFFSIHAISCPFCGCPMSYVSEHYLKKFDKKSLAEEKRLHALEIQRQQKEAFQQKSDLIRKLKSNCKCYRSAFDELLKLDNNVFYEIIDRAFYIESTVGNTGFISDENWHAMLFASDSFFQRCIKRAVEINKHIGMLGPNVRNSWEYLLSLSDSEFEKHIQREIEKYQIKRKKDIENLCHQRGISHEKTTWLLDSGVTTHELNSRIAYIDYLSNEYRRYNFNLKEYIHLSSEELQKLVASWANKKQ